MVDREISASVMRRAYIVGTLLCVPIWAQFPVPGSASPAAQPDDSKDALGRSSPRGTVLGFLTAARNGNMAAAVQYLNTPLRGQAAQSLAQQLFIVLDRRLPPRLQKLSDSPEGSLSTLKVDEDLVGTISSSEGAVDILLERVARSRAGSLWLFSKETLQRIPELYGELNEIPIDNVVPPFLLRTRFAGVLLFQWLFGLVVLPVAYILTGLLSRILDPLVAWVRRHASGKAVAPHRETLPVPVRLLLIVLLIYGMHSMVALPLLARQFWATAGTLVAIVACVWLCILIIRTAENRIRERLARSGRLATTSVVRLGRGVVETLVIFIGAVAIMDLFGVNPSTALAGLGIGGIAVALAAQKTLENVLGGVSIIFDQAVRAGDTLQVGAMIGTIEQVGLRSTRIRTRDRSVVSIPNGQLATLSLENLSLTDKFWFHPSVRLRFDTTAAQMRSILADLTSLLEQNRRIEPTTIYARFLQFGTSSLELEVSAYVMTRDRLEFLEVQEELLLRIMEAVEAAGAQIALQSPIFVAPAPVALQTEQLTSIRSNQT
jgi:MscS family membrane protein